MMGQPTATTPIQLIDEQVQHCNLTLVEGEGEKKGRVFARGEFGHAAKPTANGRFYRHNIWESNISRLRPNLESRKVLGELDHPTDGRTALQRASHVITDLKLEGDVVVGEAEILDTAKGRDLKAILAAGVPVGISSRGFGSTKPNREGVEEVQEDYKLVTFDFVAEPADSTAYPEVVFESGDPAEGVALMFEGASLEPEEAPSDDPAEEDVEDPEEGDDDPAEEEENRAPQVGAPDESELAQKFLQRALQTEGVDPLDLDQLRTDLTSVIIEQIASLRSDVEKQVREEMEQDPEIGAARTVLDEIRRAMRPFALTEDANAILEERDEEVRALRERLSAAEALVERLAFAAREAGYRYHLECLLHEDTPDVERIRAIVGDVSQYDTPDELRERVEAAREEMTAFRLEEERIIQQQSAVTEELRAKNAELAEGLEEAMSVNRELALQVYAAERLQTHPQGAKIRKMLARVGLQSKEQVDALIEDFREPVRDVDDLDDIRARVRSRLVGGREYLPEETQPQRRSGGRRDYNGLGASLEDLRHLAGLK